MTHPTHKTRISDSSLYDEVCTLCGATDANSMAALNAPCSSAAPETLHLVKRIDHVLDAVRAELLRAKAKHPATLASPHEGYAILKEEVDELWDDVKADRKSGEAQQEAIQVAAMAVRFVMEIPIVTNTPRPAPTTGPLPYRILELSPEALRALLPRDPETD